MTRDQFARHQREGAVQALYSLVMRCRERFLRAAELVEVRSDAIENLRTFGVSQAVDLASLVAAWECLCERYLLARYDPQMTLFETHEDHVKEEWSRFVYSQMFPMLVRQDETVRNILRALGALPCESPREAAAAVREQIAVMDLPGEPARWLSEESSE